MNSVGSDDQRIEQARYDARARRNLESGALPDLRGKAAVPLVYRSPYLVYERYVRELVGPGLRVLELGSGTGLHTGILLDAGAEVTATDISVNALALLAHGITDMQARRRFRTQQADMESLPFDDGSFDVVACAGSLSYGEPALVDREIQRVLVRGGSFLCVDSLNHNPIYRFNRWVHYLRGERTRSTLLRMPTLLRLETLAQGFGGTELRFFGSMSWSMGALAYIVGETRAAEWSDRIDQFVDCRSSAFKVVMVARNRT